ncbi:MAG: DUF2336 domain-containing protein [Pseudomonadota bacterium]
MSADGMPSKDHMTPTGLDSQDAPDLSRRDGATHHAPHGLVNKQDHASLLAAVSTLIALTPKGRQGELERLSALAHGLIGAASEPELLALAKAVASQPDIGTDLADRLAVSGSRAAQILIKANRLSKEGVARLLGECDPSLKVLIARHHTLAPRHITTLVATGDGATLQALLANETTNVSVDHASNTCDETRSNEDIGSGDIEPLLDESPVAAPLLADADRRQRPAADPRESAKAFAHLDAAGRRAVMHRLADHESGQASGVITPLAAAARKLDPIRNEADLTFLSIIEQRDETKLSDAFAHALSLDQGLVARLLDEADGDARMILAKAAGLSSTAFARMLILGRIGLSGSPSDIFKLVDRFNALPEAAAQMIVAAMRGDELETRMISQPPDRRRNGAQAQSILGSADRVATRTPLHARARKWDRTRKDAV